MHGDRGSATRDRLRRLARAPPAGSRPPACRREAVAVAWSASAGSRGDLFAGRRRCAAAASGRSSPCRARSSSWPKRVDAATRPRSASPCSTGCSGGWRDEPRPAADRVPIRDVAQARAHGAGRCSATCTRCTPSSASARSRTPTARAYVAWFEPAHHVVELAAPFFVAPLRQHALVDPDAGRAARTGTRSSCAFDAGRPIRADAPAEDALEDDWRAYYAAVFNPARLNPRLMRREMPKRYWREPAGGAAHSRADRPRRGRRPTRWCRQAPSEPSRRVVRAAQPRQPRAPLPSGQRADHAWRRSRGGVQRCRALRPVARRDPGRVGRGADAARG